MKKLLLFFLCCAMYSFVSAQSFTNGDATYVVDYNPVSANSSCLTNFDNDGGGAFAGGNVASSTYTNVTAGATAIRFNASSGTLSASTAPFWTDIFYTNGVSCSEMSVQNIGINLGTNQTIKFRAKASTNGAVIRFYVASSTSGAFPTSSTYNTGSGASVIKEFTLTNTYADYQINYTADADFNAWAGRAKVNLWGITMVTGGSVVDISRIEFGNNIAPLTSYIVDYDPSSPDKNCLTNYNNDGGGAFTGGNVSDVFYSNDYPGSTAVEFLATSGTLDATVSPYWVDIFSTSTGPCNAMRDDGIGIDLTTNSGIKFRAKANTNGAVVRFYLASSASGFPASSTYNTGMGGGVVKEFALTTSYVDYEINFASDAEFTAWAGKSKVNLWGITMVTSNSTVDVTRIEFGAAVTAVPTVQATNILFSNVTQTQFDLSWTRGDGSNCAVFVKEANTGSAAPYSSNAYTANSVFGSGSQINTSGWYCVYNGTGSSATVTGLLANREYSVSVIEYNGTAAGTQQYLTSPATGNPAVTGTQAAGSITVPSQAVCVGAAVNFQLTGYTVGTLPVTFKWYGPTGLIASATTANLTIPGVTLTDAGNYYAVISNSYRDYNTTNSVLTVNALPTVSAGADVTVCSGANTTLTASGATTYSWSTGQTGASITVAPTIATTYTVTGTTNGCSASDQVVVSVNALPTVSAGADVTVCSGANTTLTASGATSYSWSTGQTGASITVTPTIATTYTVTGTTNGCSASDQVVVSVNALPTVSAGADVAICNGANTTLTATGANTYSWTPGGQITASVTVNPTTTTTYTVSGTDANGCVASDQVIVTVNDLPTVSAGADVSICNGGTTTLTATGATTYSWTPGGANTATLSVNPTITTTYTVTGTTAGCTATDQVVVTVVNQLPTVSAGTDVTICNGASTTLTATGASSYTWAPGGETTATISVSPTSTTTYTVTGTSAGCTGSSTDDVTVTVDICTSIENDIATSGMSLYPNPNTGNFVIKTNSKAGRIILMNASGVVINTIITLAGKDAYEVNELSNGVYFVNFISNDGTSKAAKLIVE